MNRLLLPAFALVAIGTLGSCAQDRTRAAPVVLTAADLNATASVAGAIVAQSQHYVMVAATKGTGGNPASGSFQLHDRVLSAPGEK